MKKGDCYPAGLFYAQQLETMNKQQDKNMEQITEEAQVVSELKPLLFVFAGLRALSKKS